MSTEWKAVIEQAEEHVRQKTLPLIGWCAEGPLVLRLSQDEAQGQWYFIGDLHGDDLAWHTLFARVRRDPNFRLCFLGDVVDRGPHHVECLAALLQAAMDYPHRILWIVGNHDAAHQRNKDHSEGVPRYVSRVEPAEFVDWLNARTDDMAWNDRVLTLLNAICERLPRAALFPDGLLATHGGVPLADQWANITAIEHLEDARVLDDFTWTRAADAPRRRGWQYASERRKRSSDFEFGWRDLADFAMAFEGMFPIRRVVRGHDHVAGGWEAPAAYQQTVPLLTINGFGFDHVTNSVANYRKELVLGVYEASKLPRVEVVMVSDQDRDLCYGSATGQQAPVKQQERAPMKSKQIQQDAHMAPGACGCENCRSAIDAWRGDDHDGWPIEHPCGQMVPVQEDTDTCFVECRDQERSMDLLQCPACDQVWLRLSCNKVFCDCDSVLDCFSIEKDSAEERGLTSLAAAPLSDAQVAELRAHRGLRDLLVNDYFQLQG